ncbi:MAG: type II toxin-antitoxin system VapC family toxin [Hyphomicrobiales bacterium]|nr:type II toxin-antitoxin system VapC family toxin [Hyphomicrobiales bacterium]
MTTLLFDTHVWAWTLIGDLRISDRARKQIAGATTILVSAISFFEIVQKVRLGKWPEMARYVERLPELLANQRAVATSLEADDCLMAGTMDWPHRDPFDRLLAASALRRRIPIVSADGVFDALLTRIW